MADPGSEGHPRWRCRNGRILSQMDDSRRLYRWLYAGLHNFGLPRLSDCGMVRQGATPAAPVACLGRA